MQYEAQLPFSQLHPTLSFCLHSIKIIVIGVLMFGLMIGSLYFTYFLYRIWSLPRSSREFRQNSEFMVRENLVRYFITIGCILTMCVLLFYNFQECETAMYVGGALWGCYLAYYYLKGKVKQYTHKNKLYQI